MPPISLRRPDRRPSKGARRWSLGALVVLALVVVGSGVFLFDLGDAKDAPRSGAPRTEPGDDFDPLSYDWEANTGRSAPAAPLEPSPELVVKDEGQVVDGVQTKVGEELEIVGVTSTVRESLLGDRVRVRNEAGYAIVENNDFESDLRAVQGLAFEARFNDITAGLDGFAPTGGPTDDPLAARPRTLIEYNWVHRDGSRAEDRHHDGIQLWQGGKLTVRRNSIEGWANSAIILKSDKAPIDDVVIEENFLDAPNNFILYVRDGGHGRPTGVTIRNNAFGRGNGGDVVSAGDNPNDQAVFVRSEEERAAAIADGVDGAPTWVVWDGNYDATTGEEIVPPGGWRDYLPQR